MNDVVTVLLVDDHPLVRRGIRGFLETQPGIVVVAEAGSGEEALAAAAEQPPDVALVDLVMPDMHGVDVIRRLHAHSPRTSIVVLTSHHTDEHIFAAIRAGALSYVLKDVGPDELADVVVKAAAGEAVLHPQVAARVVAELQGAKSQGPNPFRELSERELEVLGLIAAGMTNAEIAARLFISDKTVKSHVGNILAKLHLADRTQAAVFAWRTGVAN
jgi:NarL family two-component system response regulator LiaR